MQFSLSRPGVKFFKPIVFILCLFPFGFLLMDAFGNQLGANPTKVMVRTLGDWAIYFLLIGLAMTPVRKLLGKPWPIRYRRMIGLFAFFYAGMHFLAYIWFDQYFDISEIIKDIIKRPFITIGFVNFLMLLVLAATSNKFMIKRLKQNWLRLHKLVYPIAMLALLHFFMMIKADYFRPGLLLLVLSALLGYRLITAFKSGTKRTRRHFPKPGRSGAAGRPQATVSG